jgi:hypothetical protein
MPAVRRPRPISVEAAARKDLAALPDMYRNSAVAKTYLALARRIDMGVSARDAAALTREIRMCLLTLHEMAPVKTPDDPLDEVRARREVRMADVRAASAEQPGA